MILAYPSSFHPFPLNDYSYLCSTRTRQASQRCSNVRVVLFLYISLAEILVFSNGSYFFVNIENMEENGNVLIIKGLWFYQLIALKQEFYSCTTITPIVVQLQPIQSYDYNFIVVQLQGIRLIRSRKQGIRYAQNTQFSLLDSKFTSMQSLVISIDRNSPCC